MKQIFKTAIFAALVLCVACGHQDEENVIDLAGMWQIALDPDDTGLANGWVASDFPQTIELPGTTDDAGLGIPNSLEAELRQPQLLHLTRKHTYIGAAWYTREIEIPAAWDGRNIELSLERVIWTTKVWVDGREATGNEESLTTPHRYDLSALLTPGQHRLTILVDNRKKYDLSVRNLAHAYTDHTQIIWNGIIGDIRLEAFGVVSIEDIVITPDVDTKKVEVAGILINRSSQAVEGEVRYEIRPRGKYTPVASLATACSLPSGAAMPVSETLDMGPDAKLWSEFSPNLYEAVVSFEGEKTGSVKRSMVFGMRSIEADGKILRINGIPAFMRGTLECSIFPLTGHPPMENTEWEKIFSTAKEWGLNHIRFHSWCPPEAAFEVADRLGLYLQVELPVWTLNVGEDPAITRFMYEEGERMLALYGNHPSFCFMSMGNELQSDFEVLNAIRSHFQRLDGRRLYTATSFTFEKGHGRRPEPGDDYFISQWTSEGWVRGQGVFDTDPPRFDRDFTKAVDSIPIPLITHEIGQYAIYPRLAEIPKYTGVLLPLNFLAVENDLRRKGLLEKAQAYTEASGRLAAILYKEEIEMALKTSGISGFQLLQLQDFPGQGTALVGLLDAFWESKGVISAKEFRSFSSPVTPLVRFPKATYTNDEHFRALIEVSNYGGEALNCPIVWSVSSSDGGILRSGTLPVTEMLPGYNAGLGEIDIPLASIGKASQLTVEVSLKGTGYCNSWKIWVFPAETQPRMGSVKYTRDPVEAEKLIRAGKKVLFNPETENIKGVEGKFVPVFWSPVHFPEQAGTMGLLCDPDHPVFRSFPTRMHSDWQWWDLCKRSVAMETGDIKGGSPLVEVVDNFTGNRSLSTMFEGRVGRSMIVVTSFDLAEEIDDRPAARQLLSSIVDYMNSSDFDPAPIENPEALKLILKLRN
jgi:hypothetical protein